MSITEALGPQCSGAARKFATTALNPSLWGSPTFVERNWARNLDQERGRDCPEWPGPAPRALESRLVTRGEGRVPSPSVCCHPLVLNQGQLQGGKTEPGGSGKAAASRPCASPRGLSSLWVPSGGGTGGKDRCPGALHAGMSQTDDARYSVSSFPPRRQWTMGLSFSPFLPPSLSFLLSFKIPRDYSLGSLVRTATTECDQHPAQVRDVRKSQINHEGCQRCDLEHLKGVRNSELCMSFILGIPGHPHTRNLQRSFF